MCAYNQHIPASNHINETEGVGLTTYYRKVPRLNHKVPAAVESEDLSSGATDVIRLYSQK